MWHPAALLLTWIGFALVLQWVFLPLLMLLALLCCALALVYARDRSRNLLWRARWLLLSLTILFLFATPGEYLPGIWGKSGLTYEGLRLAGEQLSRLLALLASLALVHQYVGTHGLLAGLFWLLRPFAWRKTTVVRLMLVLEYIEQKQANNWRDWLAVDANMPQAAAECFTLSMPPMRWRDRLLIGGLLVAIMAMGVWS